MAISVIKGHTNGFRSVFLFNTIGTLKILLTWHSLNIQGSLLAFDDSQSYPVA